MGDPFKDVVEKLANNVGDLCRNLEQDVDHKVANAERMTKLEQKVALLMWILAVVSLGTIGAIIAAIATLLKGA